MGAPQRTQRISIASSRPPLASTDSMKQILQNSILLRISVSWRQAKSFIFFLKQKKSVQSMITLLWMHFEDPLLIGDQMQKRWMRRQMVNHRMVKALVDTRQVKKRRSMKGTQQEQRSRGMQESEEEKAERK